MQGALSKLVWQDSGLVEALDFHFNRKNHLAHAAWCSGQVISSSFVRYSLHQVVRESSTGTAGTAQNKLEMKLQVHSFEQIRLSDANSQILGIS